jgi:uncharacterized membrane protein YidH (DUF202 family)
LTPTRAQFFANERTLLQWLHISVLILFTSLSLVTNVELSGGPTARGNSSGSAWELGSHGQLAGAVLAPVPCLFIMYALWTYLWRAARIARREPSARYDDRYGPTCLVLLLLAVVVTSITLALGQVDWHTANATTAARRARALEPGPHNGGRPAQPPRALVGAAAAAPPSAWTAAMARTLDARQAVAPGGACGMLPLLFPPFARLRGAAVVPGPPQVLLLPVDFGVLRVSLFNLSDMTALSLPNLLPDSISTDPGRGPAGLLVAVNGTLLSYNLAPDAVLPDAPSIRLSELLPVDAVVAGGPTILCAGGPGGSLLLTTASLHGVAMLQRQRGGGWAATRLLAAEALGAGLPGGAGRLTGLAFDEERGLLHLLYPHAGGGPMLRSWHLERGLLASETSLPPAGDGAADGGGAWAGLALAADGDSIYATRSFPPGVLRVALGPKGLPACPSA